MNFLWNWCMSFSRISSVSTSRERAITSDVLIFQGSPLEILITAGGHGLNVTVFSWVACDGRVPDVDVETPAGGCCGNSVRVGFLFPPPVAGVLARTFPAIPAENAR